MVVLSVLSVYWGWGEGREMKVAVGVIAMGGTYGIAVWLYRRCN